MKFIVGKKIAMTQLWQGDNVIPVTEVTVGPCTVTQLKTVEKDGYRAVQLGYGVRRASLITKALKGHFKGFGDFRYVKEFRLDNNENIGELKAGDIISTAAFANNDILTAIGTSKGKGFQGVVKRHGFHGQDATHGNKDQLRASGSVGAGGVQHVFKGIRMAGRMGGERVTIHDVKIIAINEETNSFFVKGALPGARNGLILFFGEGDLKTGLPEVKIEAVVEETPVVEETVEEVKEPSSASDEAAAGKEVAEKVETPEVKEEVVAEVKEEKTEEKKEKEVVVAEAPVEEVKEEVAEVTNEEVKA